MGIISKSTRNIWGGELNLSQGTLPTCANEYCTRTHWNSVHHHYYRSNNTLKIV